MGKEVAVGDSEKAGRGLERVLKWLSGWCREHLISWLLPMLNTILSVRVEDRTVLG